MYSLYFEQGIFISYVMSAVQTQNKGFVSWNLHVKDKKEGKIHLHKRHWRKMMSWVTHKHVKLSAEKKE